MSLLRSNFVMWKLPSKVLMAALAIAVALASLSSAALTSSPTPGTRVAATAAPTAAQDALPAGALKHATSPYLRRAASSQVRWQPFDQASFALARKLKRPVLLDIGAMWCHWCHVMDAQTYADPQVAELINSEFVPIRVDRDRRPDVNQYYQHAAADFAGAGGWPLTCFTLPDGSLFAAYGFLPPRQQKLAADDSPAMMTVLKQIATAYRDHRGKLEARAGQLRARLKREMEFRAKGDNKSPVAEILRGLGDAYDRANGGFSFGSGPKFFEFPAIELALAEGFWGRKDFGAMAARSLSRMARGGVYDQLGGGFFRYSTDQSWLIPHFEKMAYDQAMALVAYSQAYETAADPEYKQAALGTIHYVLSTLYDPRNHTFYAAQDADVSPGDNGSYYTWTASGLRKLLGPQGYRVAGLYYGFTYQPAQAPDGRFVPHRPLTLAQVAAKLGIGVDHARKILSDATESLRAARAGRRAPKVDETILVDRNALMDKGLLAAAQAFGMPKLRAIALANVDYLQAHARLADGSYAHVLGASSPVEGLAADQVYMLDALLDAYQASGKRAYLASATQLAAVIEHDFIAPGRGLVVNHEPASEAAVLGRWDGGVQAYYDGETPALQGVAAHDFAVLGTVSRKPAYLRAVASLLSKVPVSARAGMMLATVGRIMAQREHGQAVVVVEGNRGTAQTQAILDAAGAVYRPGKVLMVLQDAAGAAQFGPLVAQELRADAHDRAGAAAMVCADDACSGRIASTPKLAHVIRTFGLGAGAS